MCAYIRSGSSISAVSSPAIFASLRLVKKKANLGLRPASRSEAPINRDMGSSCQLGAAWSLVRRHLAAPKRDHADREGGTRLGLIARLLLAPLAERIVATLSL